MKLLLLSALLLINSAFAHSEVPQETSLFCGKLLSVTPLQKGLFVILDGAQDFSQTAGQPVATSGNVKRIEMAIETDVVSEQKIFAQVLRDLKSASSPMTCLGQQNFARSKVFVVKHGLNLTAATKGLFIK